MNRVRLDTLAVTPAHRPRALHLLPAAILFAGLVLGGPGFTEDPSTDLRRMPDRCQINEKGHEICTGNNSGDGNNSIFIIPAEE